MTHSKLAWLFGFLIVQYNLLTAQSDSFPVHRVSDPISLTDNYYLQNQSCNWAVSAYLAHSYVSLGFQNRYCIKEMMTESAACIFRHGQNALAIDVSHFGYAKYGELACSAGYARTFGKSIAIGLKCYYYCLHVADYQTIHSFTFDISMYADIHRKFGMGFSIYNPARLKYGVVGNVSLPIRFNASLDYKMGKNVMLFAQFDKEMKSKCNVGVGAMYKVKCLFLTVNVNFPEPSAGLCVDLWWHHLSVGARCDYILTVGLVSNISLKYSF